MDTLINLLKTHKHITQNEIGIVNRILTFMLIAKAVSEVTKINSLCFPMQIRKREIVTARHLFCYFAKLMTNKPLTEIGRYIDRDHATVLCAIRKIKNLMSYDKETNNQVAQIRELLN